MTQPSTQPTQATRARLALAFVVAATMVSAAVSAVGGIPVAAAGTVAGKVELPAAPELPAMAQEGFVARTENPILRTQPAPIAPFIVVVLDGTPPAAAPEVDWDLVGESFAHPVVAAMAGADVVIKNASRTSRTLSSVESKVLVNEVLNPSGAKTIRVEAGKVYTIRDTEAPYVRGQIITVSTPYVGYLDANNHFEIPDVPDGSYKLHVYYKDTLLDVDQPITVEKKAKGETVVKVAALKGQGK